MAKTEKKAPARNKIGNLAIDNTFTPVTYDPQYILMVNKLKKISPSRAAWCPRRWAMSGL